MGSHSSPCANPPLGGLKPGNCVTPLALMLSVAPYCPSMKSITLM